MDLVDHVLTVHRFMLVDGFMEQVERRSIVPNELEMVISQKRRTSQAVPSEYVGRSCR